MRLVLLTAHTPHGDVQHRYVAKRLAEEFPDELAAIIVATGVERGSFEKWKRWRKRYSRSEIVSRILFHSYHRMRATGSRIQESFRSILFPEGETGEMPRPDIVHRVESHNSPECLALLEELSPDVVAVYGTLIIGRKVIGSAKSLINVHTGFSPTYRGSDTIFWALHNGEPDNVGVTVHRVDAGVDSGPIFARGKPSIEPGDDEHRLFAKAVQVGAELLCSAIRREVAGIAHPVPQDLKAGREYRSVDRTLAAERRTRKLLKNGLLSEARPKWSEEF